MTTSAGQHQTNPNEVSTYSYDQTYDTIHNITRKNQVHQFKSSTQPDTTYDYTFTYPGSGSTRPHGAVAIGPYDILHDANGNLIRQTRVGTSDIVHYVYDEENRLACVHKGTQVPPNPSCNEQGVAPLEFIYDHSGVRKRKDTSSPTFYPNQFLTDIGGGTGGQFKHIFLGSLRILTMKVIPPPDKQQWYYHPDHLGSTSIVTSENGQLAEHTHYFPYGELWLQERPSTPVPYLFSSKEFDPETGLYDFGARYLNPRFAQWMTTDPALGGYLGGEGNKGVFNPLNLHLYSYTYNRPVTLIDPDGENPGVHYSGYYEGGWVIHDVRSGNWIIDNTVLGVLNQVANILPSAYNMSRDATILAGQTIAPVAPVLDAASMAAQGVPFPAGKGTAVVTKGGAQALRDISRIGPRALPAPPARLALPAPRLGPARIAPRSLPAAEEAAVLNTLAHIEAGTMPSGALAKKWGTQFKNWAGDLPGATGQASPYLEYRVAPPAGMAGAGPNRMVVNSQTGEIYYTWTHYGDRGPPAFVQIR